MADEKGSVLEHGPTFHTLRHTHGSMLVASGEDIAWVSARLGHADVNTTLKTYIHEYDKANRSKERRARLSHLSVVAAESTEPHQTGAVQAGDLVELRGTGTSRT